MNLDFVIFLVKLKMTHLGYSEQEYSVVFHHWVLRPQQKLKIEAFNEWYILSETIEDISIASTTGPYDLSNENILRQEYEHTGLIKIENQSTQVRHIKLVQVIPAKGKKPMITKKDKPC